MNRTALLLLSLTWTASACNWISLARSSLTYRTTQPGATANLVASGSLVYATLADEGLAVLDAASGQTLATVAAPPGASVDDLVLADGFLFVLDARPPGHLSIYALTDATHPELLVTRDVPVGPFSGVSAANGLCVVSGGTSQLTVWRYDSLGSLSGPLASTDFGRGQPDVLLAPSGVLYVSTHYWGPYFGLDVARFDSTSSNVRLDKVAELPLAGSGFTAGGAKPANFPIESALLGTDTLLIASARGLDVLDVSMSTRPVVVTTIDVGGPAVNVDVAGRVAAVTVASDVPALVFLYFDASPASPASPASSPRQRRVDLPVGTFPAGVALGGPRAAVAAAQAGVLFFDK